VKQEQEQERFEVAVKKPPLNPTQKMEIAFTTFSARLPTVIQDPSIREHAPTPNGHRPTRQVARLFAAPAA